MNLLVHLFTYLLTEQDLVATIVIYRDFFAIISLWYESFTHIFTTALVSLLLFIFKGSVFIILNLMYIQLVVMRESRSIIQLRYKLLWRSFGIL